MNFDALPAVLRIAESREQAFEILSRIFALQPVAADARARRVAAKLGLGTPERIDVRRIPGPVPILEVRFAGVAAAQGALVDPRTGAEQMVPLRIEGWALLGAGDAPLAAQYDRAHAHPHPADRRSGRGR